jgi:hypothetical protein
MGVSEPKPGERVKDVRFTEDTMSVDLLDGRTIVSHWFGIPSSWTQALNAEKLETQQRRLRHSLARHR